MKRLDISGQAFPVPEGFYSQGITVRDYFAAAALTGLLASDQYSGEAATELAAWAFAQADKMLAERDK